jgi:uncharacterized RDD family membrane protein YckC
MNMYVMRRLGFLFALLCATAAVTHPGVAWSKTTSPKAATAMSSAGAPAAPAGAATADDHSAEPSSGPSAGSDDSFDDESGSANRRNDWHNRLDLHRRRHARDDNDIVSVGHSSHLLSGEKAESVVSVFGSSTSDGEAVDVVSVIGDTRVTGPVRDSAIAVLGNVYIDSKVDGDVVAVLGNVTLGPHAEVGGDVVAVLGTMDRDPGAILHGSVQRILNFDTGGFGWLNTWISNCLLYGRPLALVHGLGWAWTLALALLAFYACLALMFRSSVDRCVHTLETEPGHTALAALLGILLTPVLLVLLCVTVIGIAAVPFVMGALFCMSIFGKAVMLAWLGGRVSGRRPGAVGHPAVAVLIGGALVLVLYIVPVLGFLVYKLLGFFGFGAVVYTLVLSARARRAGTGLPPLSGASTGTSMGMGPPAGPAPTTVGAAPVNTASAPSAASTAYSGASAADPSSAAMAGEGWTAGASPAGATAGPALGSSAAAAPPPPASPSVAPHITAAMPRAGFWVRMAALLLDVLLVGFVMTLLHPFHNFHVVVLAAYGAIMWKLRGTTVGGIVFDLHVVRLDGRPLDWETAIVRALGCFLSLFVVFLGFIWIAFDHNNQAWHDKIAGTVVVRAKRGAPL